MAALQWSDVVELDANLDTVPAGLQTVILARVENLSPTFFDGEDGPLYALARRLLAAHLAAPYAASSSGSGGATGPVTSRSEGGVSESYAVPSLSLSGSHSSTSHGRAFDELVKSSPNRVGVTT